MTSWWEEAERGRVISCRPPIVCAEVAEDRAPGWRAVRYDLPDQDNEPLLAFYCPECAEREFE